MVVAAADKERKLEEAPAAPPPLVAGTGRGKVVGVTGFCCCKNFLISPGLALVGVD